MNIFLNASSLHTGSGQVILNDLLSATRQLQEKTFVFYVDSRFKPRESTGNNVVIKKVKKARRNFVHFSIEKQARENDIVIYLTNIPPFAKYKCKTILVESNRFVIDHFPLTGLPLKSKLTITMQKLLFWLNKRNANYIVVQSETMFSVLKNKGIEESKLKVIATKAKENLDNPVRKVDSIVDAEPSFVYIASGNPYKNHKKLIEAWCLLSIEGIRPKLTITIDENTDLHRLVMKQVREHELDVEIRSNLDRRSILELYRQSTALIFPSFFESYGLPLVEADQYGLPVIASELDFVRDVIEPVETFDPNSAKSICRAVKRFLGIEEKKTNIVSPLEFFNDVIALR